MSRTNKPVETLEYQTPPAGDCGRTRRRENGRARMISSAILVLAGGVLYGVKPNDGMGPILTVAALILCGIEIFRSYLPD